MGNKQLIEKFIKDNFNLSDFDLKWKNDWTAILIDGNGDSITLCTFISEEIWTLINNVKHLKYRLRDCHCGSYWVVVND